MASGNIKDKEIENAIEKITMTSASARINNDFSAITNSPVGEYVDQAIDSYLKETRKNGITLLDSTSLSTSKLRKRRLYNASRDICQIDSLRIMAKNNITQSSGILIPIVSTTIDEFYEKTRSSNEYSEYVEDSGKKYEFISESTEYMEDMKRAREICKMTLVQKDYNVIENVRSAIASKDLYCLDAALISGFALMSALCESFKRRRKI